MKRLPSYLDAAATTPCAPEVVEAMMPYFTDIFGNASSNHIYGKEAKRAVEKARENVADLVGTDKKNVFFTSGATEAINWALKGFVDANQHKGNHIITVKTEHKAVLKTCEYLEERGVEVTYLDVDKNGLISIDQLESEIRNDTMLVAVMYVNNEIGVEQDVKIIADIAKKHNICFFSDATQAVGKVDFSFEEVGFDMICLSAHKMNGPKGVGALIKKPDVKLSPLIHGGGQEKGERGGTLNTPLIVGLGKACELAGINITEKISDLENRRNELEREFETKYGAEVNFKDQARAPHIISLTLSQEAEEFLLLHSGELSASTGSACNSAIIQDSHVLKEVVQNPKNIVRISIHK